MKTISKISTLILMILIISCSKEKEIQVNNPPPDIEINTDKKDYTSSQKIILKIKNNTTQEYSIKCVWPPLSSFNPYEKKEILKNGVWTPAPIPPNIGQFYTNEPLTNSNHEIQDTIKDLTYLESGTYRLEYKFRIENNDTVFYSNLFEIE